MFEEIDGYEAHMAGFALDEEVRRLGEETTELGIAAENAFKDATSGLLGGGAEATRYVTDAGALSLRVSPLSARISQILGHPALSTSHMRRAAELQRIAVAFSAIGDHAHHIATRVLSLGAVAGMDLEHSASDIYEHLFNLTSHTFHLIRASIMVTSTRDTALARRLLAEGPQHEQLCGDLNFLVHRAIAAGHGRASLYHEVLVIAQDMKAIGAETAAISRAVLHGPDAGSSSPRPIIWS